MTITKEERAELRGLIEQAAMWPLPWQVCGDADSDALVFSANEEQEEYIAEFTGDRSCDLAVAAVNASPRLLDALDAADERIAGLETKLASFKPWPPPGVDFEQALTERLCSRCKERERDDPFYCAECSARLALEHEVDVHKARIAELEAAAQSAIFALQPTWAQDPASLPATLGRAIAAHQESLQALAKGCDYVASQTDGYDRLVADPMLALGLLAVVGSDEDGDPKYKRVRLEAPIPALPEGGAK